MNMKFILAAAASAAALIGGALLTIEPAKADDYGRGHDYRNETRYDHDTYGDRQWRNWPRPARIEAEGSYAGEYMPYYVKEWRAQRTAIEVWKEKVARQYGAEFAHWRAASGKQVNCTPSRGAVYCTVSAIPSRGYGNWGWGWNGRGGWGGDRKSVV